MSELDALDPQSDVVTLSSGLVVEIQPMRMRQFFKLMRIVTRGAGPSIIRGQLSNLDDPEVFTVKLVTLVVFSIPEAEDETVTFIQSIAKPYGLIENRELNKQDKERNEELWANFYRELDNPDPGDFITLVESVVRREAEDIRALGKRLVGMFQLADKVGELKSPSSPDQNSSAASPQPATSSRRNTDGRTNKSSTSSSPEVVNVSQL